jgi:hypothetical protein
MIIGKRGRGRPPVEIDFDDVIGMAAKGASNFDICESLQVSRASLLKALRGNPERRKELDAARGGAIGSVAEMLFHAAIRGSVPAAKVVLARLGR